MAERIDSLSRVSTGTPRKYPWHEWTDGSAWRIRQGLDFQGSPPAMAAIIRATAQRLGLKVVTRVPRDEGVVEFQFREHEREPDGAGVAA